MAPASGTFNIFRPRSAPRHAAILQPLMNYEIDLDRYVYYYCQKYDPAPLANWGEDQRASA